MSLASNTISRDIEAPLGKHYSYVLLSVNGTSFRGLFSVARTGLLAPTLATVSGNMDRGAIGTESEILMLKLTTVKH